MSRYLLCLTFCFFSLLSYCQEYTVSGKVIDGETNESLAFVGLVINGEKSGGYTDIDGKFVFRSTRKIDFIHASYVGYESIEYIPGDRRTGLVIRLKKISIQLAGVVIQPRSNPAHRIILKALENRDINDPEKLKSFSYTAYEKFIFTTDVDSIMKMTAARGDSDLVEAKDFLKKQDFFIIENVTERTFIYPDKDQQRVVATKVSGFKDPIFVFLLSEFQSNSFYRDLINIGQKNFVNPVSKGSINKYYFQLKDTLYSKNQRDTTYVISFRPFKNKNFDGLQGVLYINSAGYAIQNVIAVPETSGNGMAIKIQQMYEQVDGIHWFPVQLNTDITFTNASVKVGKSNFHIIGVGKSYLKDIKINPEIKPANDAEVQIFVEPEATRREIGYWTKYRQDSLSTRELNTYHFMDSLGKKHNFDRMALAFETMMTGKIPWGYFDFDVNKVFRFNGYEGYYLGLGLSTNDRVSRLFSLGGYWGYGFKDMTAKYGGELSLFFDRRKQTKLIFSYNNDVQESGGVKFFEEDRFSIGERLRNFLIDKMDKVETKSARFGFRALNYFRFNLGLEQEQVQVGYPYYFSSPRVLNGLPVQQYNLTSNIAEFRFVYKEKFLKNSRTQLTLGSDWPVVLFQYSRGVKGLFGGDFNYDRFDIKVTKSFFTKYLGRTSICLTAGLVKGELPVGELFNGHGSYHGYTIFAPNSFATMRMNEFITDRYTAVYFNHNFGKLLVRWKHFQPEIGIAADAAIGSLDHPEDHHVYTFSSLEKGYLESGILLNNLLNLQFYSVGFGGFYRLGSYAFPDWHDNVALKFSVTMPF